MKSPYDARQAREAANAGRVKLLLDAADHVVCDPRNAGPDFYVYPTAVAKAAGIEPYTYAELQHAVRQMQAAGWQAEIVYDQRDGDFIRLRNPAVPAAPPEPKFRIPGRD